MCNVIDKQTMHLKNQGNFRRNFNLLQMLPARRSPHIVMPKVQGLQNMLTMCLSSTHTHTVNALPAIGSVLTAIIALLL